MKYRLKDAELHKRLDEISNGEFSERLKGFENVPDGWVTELTFCLLREGCVVMPRFSVRISRSELVETSNETDSSNSCLDELDPRLKKIADHYGLSKQSEKAIEEMAELIVAIKNLYKHEGSWVAQVKNFAEELADVKIMIDQLVYLYEESALGASDLKPEIEFKIERQLKRIAEEEISK